MYFRYVCTRIDRNDFFDALSNAFHLLSSTCCIVSGYIKKYGDASSCPPQTIANEQCAKMKFYPKPAQKEYWFFRPPIIHNYLVSIIVTQCRKYGWFCRNRRGKGFGTRIAECYASNSAPKAAAKFAEPTANCKNDYKTT